MKVEPHLAPMLTDTAENCTILLMGCETLVLPERADGGGCRGHKGWGDHLDVTSLLVFAFYPLLPHIWYLIQRTTPSS